MRQQKEWLKRCRIGLILLFMLSLVVHLAHLDSFDWKKKKGPLMGLCDRYKCGTFCEDYFKLRDQVTDALRDPPAASLPQEQKLYCWANTATVKTPGRTVHSQHLADGSWTAPMEQFGVKCFTQGHLDSRCWGRREKKSLEESTFLTWVPVWVIAAFLLKQKPQN